MALQGGIGACPPCPKWGFIMTPGGQLDPKTLRCTDSKGRFNPKAAIELGLFHVLEGLHNGRNDEGEGSWGTE